MPGALRVCRLVLLPPQPLPKQERRRNRSDWALCRRARGRHPSPSREICPADCQLPPRGGVYVCVCVLVLGRINSQLLSEFEEGFLTQKKMVRTVACKINAQLVDLLGAFRRVSRYGARAWLLVCMEFKC